jgi:hypothetical protein
MSRKEVSVVAAILGVAVLLAVGISTAAHAEPAQQVNLRISGAPDGRTTFRLFLRLYDTTGAVPPALTDFHLRLPAGLDLRREFLHRRYLCDGRALRAALEARPNRVPFTRRVANLEPFIRSLARGDSKADRAALAIARTCERARLGGGTALLDARNVADVLSEPIPTRFSLFLSRGATPGAIAAFTVIGAADERAPIVRRFPVVAGVHAVLTTSIVADPSPDGRYGYKVLLPTGPINGFDISIAEVKATVRALKIGKGTCLRSGARRRCTKRQRSDLVSFVVPRCPPSGLLSAELFAAFASPTPSLTTALQLPCPRFEP